MLRGAAGTVSASAWTYVSPSDSLPITRGRVTSNQRIVDPVAVADAGGVSEDPLVPADLVGTQRAAIVDVDLTRVVNDALVKVMAWNDNEWHFTHQMLREARSILGVSDG